MNFNDLTEKDKAGIYQAFKEKWAKTIGCYEDEFKSKTIAKVGDKAKDVTDGTGSSAGVEAGAIDAALANKEVDYHRAKTFHIPSTGKTIQQGSLVQVNNSQPNYFFMVPVTGPGWINYEGLKINFVTPQSPIYKQMNGKDAGSKFVLGAHNFLIEKFI